MNVTSVSAGGNDSGGANFIVFMLSLRPSAVNVDTMGGKKIALLWGVLTGWLVPPSRVGSNSNGTSCRGYCACGTVSEEVS